MTITSSSTSSSVNPGTRWRERNSIREYLATSSGSSITSLSGSAPMMPSSSTSSSGVSTCWASAIRSAAY
eukprot:1813219-Prymnesium_polylepis.1